MLNTGSSQEVYCAIKHPYDFRKALIAAVNHNGDSDSTGAITGNILGAFLGVEAIPDDWRGQVELSDVLLQVADDLLAAFSEETGDAEKHPGF